MLSKIYTLLLRSMIVFFSSAGLLGASMFLLGEVGELEWKVLGTALSLGWYSLLGLVCSSWLSDTRRLRWVASAGLITAGLSAILSVILIWKPDEIWSGATLARVSGTLGILAFAIPHGLIVFSHERELYETVVQIVTFLSISSLSLLGIAVTWELVTVSELSWRLVGFLSILDIAGTIVALLLRRVK